MAAQVAVQRATTEETFVALCKDFKLDDAIEAGLLAAGIQDLEGFRFYFVKEDEIAAFVAKLQTTDDPLQSARMRRA